MPSQKHKYLFISLISFASLYLDMFNIKASSNVLQLAV